MGRSHPLVRRGWRIGATVGLAAALLAVGPPVEAGPLPANCTQLDDQVTCTFAATPHAPQSWVAPAAVESVTVTLLGGAGGNATNAVGGKGAELVATIPVTPGATYILNVGEKGDIVSDSVSYNGGGEGNKGGSPGGGATDLRRAGGTLADRLLVAGGGGGAAKAVPANGTSSDGGASGHPGQGGAKVLNASGGDGGGAGTAAAGGSGGTTYPSSFVNEENMPVVVPGTSGTAGTAGQGGSGGSGIVQGGGGGGGGYYGGGGGGAGSTTPEAAFIAGSGDGGGGGGGSSFVDPSSTRSALTEGMNDAAGSATITYTVPGGDEPPAPEGRSEGCQAIHDGAIDGTATVFRALGPFAADEHVTITLADGPDGGTTYEASIIALEEGGQTALTANDLGEGDSLDYTFQTDVPRVEINEGISNGSPDATWDADCTGDPDVDDDGAPDATDNCPAVANPGQEDADLDALGDACDPYPSDPTNMPPDGDGDGTPDATDSCPSIANEGQADTDGDGHGDACEITVTISDTAQTYDGTPRPVTVAVTPGSLTPVVTYDASATVPTAAGSYAVSVTVDGGADYVLDPSPVTATLTVAKATQTITFDELPDAVTTDGPIGLEATATSELTVAFAADGPCTLEGATLTITGTGDCTVTASQAGDINHEPAAAVAHTFTITTAPQTIDLEGPDSAVFQDGPFAVTASASSGLPVDLSVDGPCTIEGTTVTPTAAGDCTVTASQAGDGTYAAAPDATVIIPISVAPVTITGLPNPLVPGADVTVEGAGFVPGEEVSFVLASDPVEVGTAMADGDGTASLTFTVPTDLQPGTHTLTATGADSGLEVSATSAVAEPDPDPAPDPAPVPDPDSTGGTGGSGGSGGTTEPGGTTSPAPVPLPATGAASSPLLLAGLALSLAGLGAMRVRRRLG